VPPSTQPAQAAGTLRKSATIAWIGSGVGLILLVIGIAACARAETNSQQALAILLIVFGGIFLVIGIVLALVFLQTARSASAVDTGDADVWARWACSSEESARFVAAEKTRLKVSSKIYWWIMIAAFGMWLFGVLSTRGKDEPFNLGTEVMVFVIFMLLGTGFAFLVRKMSSVELNRARRSAKSETLLTDEGIFTARLYYQWRHLLEVKLEPGTPMVVQFDFPGPAVGYGRRAKDAVRIPVPHAEATRAQEIVANLRTRLAE
jgi:hypothetical protein